jgi:hypothetical protein
MPAPGKVIESGIGYRTVEQPSIFLMANHLKIRIISTSLLSHKSQQYFVPTIEYTFSNFDFSRGILNDNREYTLFLNFGDIEQVLEFELSPSGGFSRIQFSIQQYIPILVKNFDFAPDVLIGQNEKGFYVLFKVTNLINSDIYFL